MRHAFNKMLSSFGLLPPSQSFPMGRYNSAYIRLRQLFWLFVLVILAQVFLGAMATNTGIPDDQLSISPDLVTQTDKDVTSALPDLYEASIAELQQGLEKGLFTSVDLVKVKYRCSSLQKFACLIYTEIPFPCANQAYLARIEEVNHKGASLHAVIETNPQALAQAAAFDRERKTKPKHELGPLHGIPILVKDNIATLHEEGRVDLTHSWDEIFNPRLTPLITIGMNTTAGMISSEFYPLV